MIKWLSTVPHADVRECYRSHIAKGLILETTTL